MSKIILTKDKESLILEYFNKGITHKEIAKLFNVDRTTISLYLKRNGLYRKKYVLNDDKNKIIDLYNQGNSTEKIGKILNCSASGIINVLRKNQIKIKNREEYQKYYFNESFFEKIDNQEKAYCLGLWCADGCNHGNKKYISIQMNDLDIIEKVKNCFKYDGPITVMPKQKNRKVIYKLTFGSKKLCSDLTKLGCIARKSRKLKFLKNIDEKLMSHFIRGLYDGDGGISDKPKIWRIYVYGTKSICNGLKKFLKDGRIYVNRINKKDGYKTYGWSIHKKLNIKKFLDYIYQNSVIHLNRKYEKAQYFLNSFPNL